MVRRCSLITGTRDGRKRSTTFLLFACIITFNRLGVVNQARLLTSLTFMCSKLFISAMRTVFACHFVSISGRLTRIIIVISTLETARISHRFFCIAVERFDLDLYERHFSAWYCR